MRIKFSAAGGIYSLTVGQLRFTDGDEADLPEKEARQILKQWPKQFTLLRPDSNKMMQNLRDK